MNSDAKTLTQAWSRLGPGQPVHGISAVLLPFRHDDGEVDWAGFERHLSHTHESGLGLAVNMDTGFGDLLSPAAREDVLRAVRRVLGPDVPFWAGAYCEDETRPVKGYQSSFATIEAFGARPVIVQCQAMHHLGSADKARVYGEIVGFAPEGALAFELSPRFAPHGEIWDDETFARLLQIEGLRGAKHSSLDRSTELRRLSTRDRDRPDWRVYTGNDLAIDMVAYGSDYLLGLATFAPERFAERDCSLENQSHEFLSQNDALQHLGNVGFRTPIPAYKHAAAQFLHITGRLEGDTIHPKASRRPASDRILLFDCALRLGLIDDPDRAMQEKVVAFLP